MEIQPTGGRQAVGITGIGLARLGDATWVAPGVSVGRPGVNINCGPIVLTAVESMAVVDWPSEKANTMLPTMKNTDIRANRMPINPCFNGFIPILVYRGRYHWVVSARIQ